MQLGSPERLIRVDIADSADYGLVEQCRLQRDTPPLQFVTQAVRAEAPRQWFDTDFLMLQKFGYLGMGHELQPGELPNVGQVENRSVVQAEHHMARPVWQRR